ncbi:EamA family transporter [Paenibacillus sp.]|uniref:EamA family transporter n=1 Tax=Paenibacillus sp. TaxID=58172 RepID=UPI002D361384|nr:EamA family transporter [Paenibacillus sp.]HZG86187.1 EamA family transporter [Paenibacillus sp.]
MSIHNLLLVLANAVLLIAGQFCWKLGVESRKIHSLADSLHLLFTPMVMAGLILYGVATILWLFILSRVPLSVAYPIQSVAYVFGVVGAHYLFKETITVWKIAGCLLIVAGVSLIAIKGR